MDPELHRYKTGTIQTLALTGNDRRIRGFFSLRIFSAVFVTGKITSAAVVEAVDHTVEIEFHRQSFAKFFRLV